MAVVGVLAALVHPGVDPERSQADAAAKSLHESLMEAHRRALGSGHEVAVTFRPGAGTYTVHADVDGDGSVDAGEREITRTLPEGVGYGIGDARPHPAGAGPVSFDLDRRGGRSVVFYGSGSASEGGGIYLVARGRESQQSYTRLLVVERTTGRTTRYAFVDGTWKHQR